ncbi:MAG TPA: hypothetical protein VFV41_19480, partial [Streptosporangiaceae bacterium]|nr:hypothetical protein [Streptosporangiaceae bacterium]
MTETLVSVTKRPGTLSSRSAGRDRRGRLEHAWTGRREEQDVGEQDSSSVVIREIGQPGDLGWVVMAHG